MKQIDRKMTSVLHEKHSLHRGQFLWSLECNTSIYIIQAQSPKSHCAHSSSVEYHLHGVPKNQICNVYFRMVKILGHNGSSAYEIINFGLFFMEVHIDDWSESAHFDKVRTSANSSNNSTCTDPTSVSFLRHGSHRIHQDGCVSWIEIDDLLSTPKNCCNQFEEGKNKVNFKTFIHVRTYNLLRVVVIFRFSFSHRPWALSFLRYPLASLASKLVYTNNTSRIVH